MNLVVEISSKLLVEGAFVWLSENMPNTPLTELERWTIDPRIGLQCNIRFQNEEDAFWFLLRWS